MSRRLLASYLSLALLVLVVLEVPLGISHARSERSATLTRLERDAVSVGSFAEDTLQHGGSAAPLAALARRYGDEADGGVLVVDRSGRTIAASGGEESGAGPTTGPELRLALAGRVRTGEAGGWLYAAVPVSSGGVVHGAVRTSSPVADLSARIRTYWLRLLALAAGVLVLVARSASSSRARSRARCGHLRRRRAGPGAASSRRAPPSVPARPRCGRSRARSTTWSAGSRS